MSMVIRHVNDKKMYLYDILDIKKILIKIRQLLKSLRECME
jgi:hypothetical protein